MNFPGKFDPLKYRKLLYRPRVRGGNIRLAECFL